MSKAKKSTPTTGRKAGAARAGKRSTKAASPATPASSAKAGSRIALMVEKLRGSDGASLDEIAKATGWQHHSIRGAISGHLKKKLNLTVDSEKDEAGVRRYRIAG